MNEDQIKHQLKHGKITLLTRDQMKKCPHYIMLPEHYTNTDGNNCHCTSEDETIMKEWGYIWNGFQWDTPERNDELEDEN
tara:strand:+ start:159 stop:398 length:240 start_codon:yes stop_codon:yes gene_type:complete